MARIGINLVTGSLQKDEMIVGIDLGTTNSLIAIMHPESQNPVVLKEFDNSSLVPSLVYFDHQNGVVVGDQARQHLLAEPERTIFSAKRLMGRSFNDIKETSSFLSYKIIETDAEELVKVQVGDRFYSPVDLSSFILKELKTRAEHILKAPVTRAVITVPAYFNDAQRQATRDAGKLAGLDVLRIINEPTAASLAYGIGLDKSTNRTVAVYDLGGGTFDVSVLRIHDGVFDVISTHGDTILGGDDMDRLIVKYWSQEYGIAGNESELRLLAEEAKKHLSSNFTYEAEAAGHKIKITKDRFEALISPLVQRTIDSCRNALKDAGLQTANIDEVIMVGGSTRVPLVKKMVSEFFGRPVHDELNPDEVVALGAAVQADVLAGNNKEYLLLDITPLSLGIETSGGLMEVLIPRNSKIPSGAARQYTTQVDGQSGIRVSVFQGERDLVKDNRKLAEFNLTGIPAMPAGLPKVEIKFLINADGILTVSATEIRSGVAQSIEVKPQYGITDEDVEKMLLDSIEHAQEDISARALAEAASEGEQLLTTTEKFLQKNNSYLTQEELLSTAGAMQALQLSLTMNDKDLIHKKIEELNEISRPYAERVMDEAVSSAMKGKII